MRGAVLGTCVALSAVSVGCGLIADPSRMKIAKIGDRIITRGDFANVLRTMPEDERPLIETKGDFVQAVKAYLDEQVKTELAAVLEGAGKLDVPRKEAEAMLRAARPELFGDAAARISEAVSEDLGEDMVLAMEAEREALIDLWHLKLLGNRALAQRMRDSVENSRVSISDEEFESEYKLRKYELKVFERIQFMALRFPTFLEDAEARAAEARRRVDENGNFFAVAGAYKEENPQFVIESDFENNPAATKFAGFWQSVSGCEKGDVIGPVFLPASERVAASGRGSTESMPAAFLVLKVLEHWPERVRTFEEAKPILATDILVRKVMAQLREEYGVEVYEDNIPDPQFLEQAL